MVGDKEFNVYVANLGKYNELEDVGEWISFPIDGEELGRIMTEKVGIEFDSQKAYEAGMRGESVYEEWAIHDLDIEVEGLSQYIGEYESLTELNYLAQKLDELEDYEMEVFEAVLEYGGHTDSVKELINLTDNLDGYDFMSGINNESDLGYYYAVDAGIYESVTGINNYQSYFDEEDYGRDIRLEEGGYFEGGDYIYDVGDGEERLEGIGSDQELGEHYSEDGMISAETASRYFDYEAFGRDIDLESTGSFVDGGYLRDNGGSFIEHYTDRDDIPEELRMKAPEVGDEKVKPSKEEKPSLSQVAQESREASSDLAKDTGKDAPVPGQER